MLNAESGDDPEGWSITTAPNPEEWLRYLRAACIHEFAHAAVARSFGVGGHVTITPNLSGGKEEKCWVGNFSPYNLPDDSHVVRLIGLAGSVAEEYADKPEIEAWEILDSLECGSIYLSTSDAKLAGDFAEHDLETTLALVRKLWPEIEHEAMLTYRLYSEANSG